MPDEMAIEVPPGPLTMGYDPESNGYYVRTGDGRKVAWTMISLGQCINEFYKSGAEDGITGCIRRMLSIDGAAKSVVTSPTCP